MPFDPSDGYSSGSYVPGGVRPRPVDRGPLLEDFRGRFPDVEGDLGEHLDGRFRSEVSRALMLPEDDPSFDVLLERYSPVWENEAQRQAMMAIAASPGGMEKIREAFPGEYDRGEVSPDQVDSLLPPGARRVMEAMRDREYYRRLMDEDRPLADSDIAIGTAGGGNLMRQDKTNWFDTAAMEGGTRPMTAFGGPNYFQAQEHPVAVEVAMNPNAPATTAILGAMGVVPQLTRHSVSKGELAPERAIGEIGNSLSFNYLTEMPSANVPPVNSRGRVPLGNAEDAQADKIRNLVLMQQTQADQGQQFLQNFLPDSMNTPALAMVVDAGVDFLDQTGPRALTSGVKLVRNPATGRRSVNIKGLVDDLRNEGVMGVPMGLGAEQLPESELSGVEQGMQREKERAAALPALAEHLPQGYVQDAVQETNPVFQKMTMTNPHLQADRLKLARERYERDRQSAAREKPSLFAYRGM